METKKILLAILMFSISWNWVQGQGESIVYDFPIQPGTPEWDSLDTYEDRLDAYNIPNSVLKVMNTADLVRTCLSYPEFRLIMTQQPATGL